MPGKAQTSKKHDPSTTKIKLGATTAVLVSGFAAYHAVHAVAATATLPIIARLIRAIDLTVNTTLDFGVLAMTQDRAGVATIDPELNQLVIDDNSSLTLAGGKPTAGRIFMKGSLFPVALSVEDSVVTLTNGTNTVQVSNFNLMSAQGGTKMTFTPTAGGTYSFSVPVGASINTRQGQISGTYTGTTRIFASYQ